MTHTRWHCGPLTTGAFVFGLLIILSYICLEGGITVQQASGDGPTGEPRGRALLDRLAQGVPQYKELKISPDGTKTLYIEVTQNSESATLAASERLWMLDIASGRMFKVAGQEGAGGVHLEGVFLPQWARDSHGFALLQAQGTAASLIIYATSESAAPEVIRLEQFGTDFLQDAAVYNWQWLSDRDQLLISLVSKKRGGITDPDGSAKSQPFFQLKSQPATGKDVATVIAEGLSPIRLVLIDIPSRKATGIKSAIQAYGGAGERQRYYGRPGNYMTRSSDGRFIVFTAQVKPPRSYAEFNASNALFALDLSTVTLRQVYSGPYVYSMSSSARQPGYFFAVRGRSILHTDFYEIRQISLETGESHLAAATLLPIERTKVSGHIFGGSRPNVVYQHVASAPEQQLYELDLQSERRTLISPVDLSLTESSVSADGRTIIAVLENVNTPPNIHVWKSSDRNWRPLTASGVSARDVGVGEVQRLTWRSKDDRFDVDGFLVKPLDFDPSRKYPLLVFLHGGIGGGVTSGFNLMFGVGGIPAHVFAAEGYLVLVPNFRGDKGRTVDFTEALTGHHGQEYDYDIDAGVDYLIDKGWVDGEKLGIVGHSYGATQMIYALSHTNRYKAAVDNDGPFLLPQVRIPYCGEPAEEWMRLIGYDPVERVWVDPQNIRTPLLLRMSSYTKQHDHCASVQYTYLHSVLARHGIPVDILEDQDEHVVKNKTYILEYQNILLRWFDRYLKPGS